MLFSGRTKPFRMFYAFLVVTAAMGIYMAIPPRIQADRIEGIMNELTSKYHLVIRYGDPSEFWIAPQPPVDKVLNDIRFKRVDMRYVLPVLEELREALRIYPPELIKKYLSAVFIAGEIKDDGWSSGGMYWNSWIYLNASLYADDFRPSRPYAMVFHGELSSFFFSRADFPVAEWASVNDPNFQYFTNDDDIVRAAARKSQRDPKEAPSWYRSGFVDDYGMSSMENDFNMYAELAMGQPAKLIELAKKYPKLAKKTSIFVKFYCGLAPELRDYFKSAGLLTFLNDTSEQR